MRAASIALGVVALGMVGAAAGAQAREVAPQRPPFLLCVLDQAAVIQQSRLAQDMGARFQQVRQKAQAKLEDDRRTLAADTRALDSLRSALPPAVVKERDADLTRRNAELQAQSDQINRNLTALDGQLTANVFHLSDPSVRAEEAGRGCSMLIDSDKLLHLDDASLDITAGVIARMNAQPLPPAAGR